MINIQIVLCGVLLAFAMFTLLLFIYTYRKHDLIAKYFSYLSLSISIYVLGYGMELYSNSLQDMIFWNHVQYIGLPFLPAIWVMFALEYNNIHLKPIPKASIFLIPILTFILRHTGINNLYYLSMQLTTNKYFPVLYIQKGPWYWVQVIFITACCVVSNYLFFIMYRKSNGSIRRQSLIMLIATFLPWISLLLNLFNLSPLYLDYGPFALTCSMLLFFYAFFRYQLLNIKPLARDKIFESTNDGIIVLDTNYNIIDFNLSAASICSALKEHSIGKNVQEVLGQYKALVQSILNYEEACCELNDSKGNYKVNTVTINEPPAQKVGYIVTLTDITKYMDMMEELNNLASRDMLTGVFNRRYFVKLSSQELENSKRFHNPVSLIILDIDFFKQVNDSFGHHAGDAVLQEVAGICANTIRTTDIIGRFGGEEFVIFLPETTLFDGQIIANRILTHIAAAEINYEGKPIKVTASLGITGVDHVTKENLNYLIKIADMALYRAKSEGRNCVRSMATTA